ncbi:hypothetical protein BDB00DRAFT_976966 [Zychaea mexicana]|uniref:uncharacterized protein n=1 Tax=Zychaea mexicana TaxID=64656 RepID=UPI0022FDC896|nr:uncharacterized protein BDB00DRAFT_976966 [Zychaea mexicana]KAI9492490.1 hypothetical protein BDB00DRAFT_976966 [Zychaea mexicana]
MTSDTVSHYELKRKQLIEENQKLLQELGLTGPDNANLASAEMKQFKSDTPTPRKKPRNAYRAPKPAIQQPTRLSKRLKGEQPDDTVDLEAILDQNDKMRQVNVDPIISARKKEEESYAPDSVSAPVTLLSIGTTIWELGSLKTGKGRSQYWSGRGCRYKHPYPIGFKATKSHFGNDYTMTIEEGKPNEGPVFKVYVNSSKTVFTGGTPTAPWTDACKKSKSQGTRVSGPLFYGFSDIITMRIIESMEGYKLASKPEEEEGCSVEE